MKLDFLGNEIKEGMLCVKIGHRWDEINLELGIVFNVNEKFISVRAIDGKTAHVISPKRIIVETGFKQKLIK